MLPNPQQARRQLGGSKDVLFCPLMPCLSTHSLAQDDMVFYFD
jgi:hypothetical protein